MRRGPSAGDAPAALFLHGYPESSYLWRSVLPAVAEAGWRALAPDLPGFGDAPADPPGTWERHMEAVERFRRALEIERLTLVVHDWGGLHGLRWACEHPDAVRALWRTASQTTLSITSVYVEYLMLAGANDRYEQALQLAALLERGAPSRSAWSRTTPRARPWKARGATRSPRSAKYSRNAACRSRSGLPGGATSRPRAPAGREPPRG